jgi:hypothetical protein
MKQTIQERNMTYNKLFKALFIACLSIAMINQIGCVDVTDITGTTDTSDNSSDSSSDTNTDTDNDSASSSTTPVLTITSLTSDVTVAQGKGVLLTWQIQNLPTTPTINVLYGATTQSNYSNLVTGLTTSNVGSLQLDTSSLVAGLTYKIKVVLYSAGTQSASALATGKVTIGAPSLTVQTPLNDTVLLPSSTQTITWTGAYIPAGSSLETFLDSDTTYNNGNETIVKTDSLTTSSSNISGSITLEAMDLWNNVNVNRSVPYYVGLRVVKNGQISIASYASATLKLYGGEKFSVTSPTSKLLIHAGDEVTVRWSTTGVPSTLSVNVYLIDEATDAQIDVADVTAVTAGGVTIDTASLLYNHTYDVIAQLMDGNTVISVKTAAGSLFLTTTGAAIAVTAPNDTDTAVNVNLGDTYTITWSLSTAPAGGVVDLYLDQDGDLSTTSDQVRITSADGVAASLGKFDLTPEASAFAGKMGLDYYVIAQLRDDTQLFDTDVSSGQIHIGGIITITNSDLAESDDLVYLGIGNTYTVVWTLNNAPANGVVDLYLDVDGDLATTEDQVQVTDNAGVSASLLKFDLTPTTAAFATLAGEDFYVIARIRVDATTYDETISTGKIHVGHGGVTLSIPNSDSDLTTPESLPLGSTLTITWATTGDICNQFAGKTKILKLYIDTKPAYDSTTSVEITPADGLNACRANTTYTFDPMDLTSDQYTPDTPYFVIGRLIVQDVTEDETRVATAGTFSIQSSAFNVLTPAAGNDIASNYSSVSVTWTITNISTAGKYVRIQAVGSTYPNGILICASDTTYAASDDHSTSGTAAIADASKLPPGTYTIHCEVFGYDSDGNEVIYAQADAGGKIIVQPGYIGAYLLSDMATAALANTDLIAQDLDPKLPSPIDGTIFEGENISDLSAYQFASIGNIDIDKDGYDDFFIFARYGEINNMAKAGSGYLIYGKKNFRPLEMLSNVATGTPSSIDGTVILLPIENAATLSGATYTGSYQITSVPDFSNTGLNDLLVACPTARPLLFTFKNNDTENPIEFVDYYGTKRTIVKGGGCSEYSHVFPWFDMTTPTDDPGGAARIRYYYGSDYYPGNTIDVQFDKDAVSGHTMKVTIDKASRDTRGCCYLLTGERLVKYKNALFNMTLVGSPIETDSLTGYQVDQMYVWNTSGVDYGLNCSVLPDMNDNGQPEMIISTSLSDATDKTVVPAVTRAGAGLATIYDSAMRATSYNLDGSSIWTFGDTLTGDIWRTRDRGSDFLGGYVDTNGQPLTNMTAIQVDVIGSSDNAALTSVSGMTGTTPRALAGDYDGNGSFDFLAGTPGENGGEGAIYVINLPRFMYKYTVTQMDLAKLNTVSPITADPDFQMPVIGMKITGDAGDKLGDNAKAIGDFNGDGLADFVIALPNRASADASKTGVGRIMIVFGKSHLPQERNFAIDELTSSAADSGHINALIFEGVNQDDHFGKNVCAVYDVNKDGYDDLLVAAPDADNGAATSCGKIYLIYGRPNIVLKDPIANTTAIDYNKDGAADGVWSASKIGTDFMGAVFVGEAKDDQLQTMSYAGDVNDDGVNDFLIGAPYANGSNSGPADCGKAYLILGREVSWPTN